MYSLIFLSLISLCSQIGHGDADASGTPSDRFAQTSRLIKELLEKANPDVRPFYNGTVDGVRGTLDISIIDAFEGANGQFSIDGWLKLDWADPRFAWNPQEFGHVSTLRIHPFDAQKPRVWLPDIVLYRGHTKDLLTHKPRVVITNNGRLNWIVPQRWTVPCRITNNGPKREVSCNLTFGSWTYDGFELDFTSTNVVDVIDFENAKWSLTGSNLTKTVMHYDCCPESFPKWEARLMLLERGN